METNDRSTAQSSSAEDTILRVAGKLRALSNNGLRFADDPYQVETFEQILALSAELTGLVDVRSPVEIRRHFLDDKRYISPYTVVDTASFDDAGRILLIQRKDNGRWALPGGWCEVNELPAEGAVREVWEETGCRVALNGFLGIFDNNYHGGGGLNHLYCLLFAARHIEGTPFVTSETLDVGWFTLQEIPWDALQPAHDARIRYAFAWRQDPSLAPFYDAPRRQPHPTWQHDARCD